MKKATLMTAGLMVLLVAASPAAYAISTNASVNATLHASSDVSSTTDNGNGSVDTSMHMHNATSSEHMNMHASTSASTTMGQGRQNDEGSSTASTTEHGHGAEGMGALHRSIVASFVQSLLADASRDGGIGPQVREVAQHQNDTATTTATAMTKIESRSKVLTFLFGADWNDLTVVRQSISDTQQDIVTLQAALAQATDAQVKADLSAQIQVLEQEQARMQSFVDAHDSGFSLLGWFTKLFAKSSGSGSTGTTTSATTTASSTA